MISAARWSAPGSLGILETKEYRNTWFTPWFAGTCVIVLYPLFLVVCVSGDRKEDVGLSGAPECDVDRYGPPGHLLAFEPCAYRIQSLVLSAYLVAPGGKGKSRTTPVTRACGQVIGR